MLAGMSAHPNKPVSETNHSTERHYGLGVSRNHLSDDVVMNQMLVSSVRQLANPNHPRNQKKTKPNSHAFSTSGSQSHSTISP